MNVTATKQLAAKERRMNENTVESKTRRARKPAKKPAYKPKADRTNKKAAAIVLLKTQGHDIG
jgi:hypothetical protein